MMKLIIFSILAFAVSGSLLTRLGTGASGPLGPVVRSELFGPVRITDKKRGPGGP